MWQAMIIFGGVGNTLLETTTALTWLGGTLFGALWTASQERGKYESARLYARLMALSYFLSFLSIVVSR